jgi:hypothetical protein
VEVVDVVAAGAPWRRVAGAGASRGGVSAAVCICVELSAAGAAGAIAIGAALATSVAPATIDGRAFGSGTRGCFAAACLTGVGLEACWLAADCFCLSPLASAFGFAAACLDAAGFAAVCFVPACCFAAGGFADDCLAASGFAVCAAADRLSAGAASSSTTRLDVDR